MAKLKRTVATYEAISPADIIGMPIGRAEKLIADAQADIGLLADTTADLLGALKAAEAFIATFEGDDLQDGIGELLDMIRNPIKEAEAL